MAGRKRSSATLLLLSFCFGCSPVRTAPHPLAPLTADEIAEAAKVIKDSILPRCLWFDEHDIDESKSQVLVRKAQPSFRELQLVPWIGTVSELRVRLPAAKIERLIVGVDSRRARRRLQSELPREVYDASTTGIEIGRAHV